MCTVTYIPKGKNKYLFTTSRDEHRDRPRAHPPGRHRIGQQDVQFPRDPVGGGSWIVAAENLSLCLLNGAFRPHQRNLPYRHSRGLIPLHFLEYTSAEAFLAQYDFSNLEPFTLLVVSEQKINEIRWDGEDTHHKVLPSDKPEIWASAPLYTREMLKMREDWFSEFLSEYPSPSVRNVFEFYTTEGHSAPYSALIIDRENGVRTVSICAIEKLAGKKKVHYWERGVDFA
nr:NRDE family protein [Saprospiraceae bacterium]